MEKGAYYTMTPESMLTKLLCWRNAFWAKHNQRPETVPVSVEEIDRLVTDTNCLTYMECLIKEPPQVADMIMETTAFSEYVRASRLKMPVIRLTETAKFEPHMEVHMEARRENEGFNYLFRRIDAFVIGETSKVEFKIEADPWSKVKRWLRLTRWFPIRKVKVQVDCTVLYPYVKVTLPHNRHTVKFSAAPT